MKNVELAQNGLFMVSLSLIEWETIFKCLKTSAKFYD